MRIHKRPRTTDDTIFAPTRQGRFAPPTAVAGAAASARQSKNIRSLPINCRFYRKFLTEPRIQAILDSGYTGIDKIHKNSLIPRKSSKKHPLSYEDKAFNREISRKRIYIEHVNRHLKRFRILSSRYRNKRKRFAFRVSLICGFFNAMH